MKTTLLLSIIRFKTLEGFFHAKCIPKGLPELNNMVTQMNDGRDRVKLRCLVNELRFERKNWYSKHVKQNYSMGQIHQSRRPSHTVQTRNHLKKLVEKWQW